VRERDAQIVADAIGRDFPDLGRDPPPPWDAPPPVKVIDCVLSLNRKYDTFVTPRVEAFARDHPEVTTCPSLRSMIQSFDSPAKFMEAALNLSDARRAITLAGVTEFAIDAQARFDGETEELRLRQWARDARPGDYLAVGVPGFALAGFQYLRLNFGADTTKPDVHVIRYVSDVVGRDVSDVEALYIVERAASLAGLSVAGLDSAIWKAATQS
jgi:hypothetical protein